MSLLSIVTPTYNRVSYLRQCFASLKAQTDLRFEWIVVDDGSTDGTGETVAAFQAGQPPFPIRYLYQENGGKHRALNAAHPLIRGDWVLVLDSDDRLIPTAVERIHWGWETYGTPGVGIVIFLEGAAISEPFAVGRREGVPLDMYRSHIKPIRHRDCCDVYLAEAFLKYPYPEFAGEKFLSESILWNRMAPDYQIVYCNEVLYLAEYLETGLTRSGRPMRISVPQGGMYAANLYLDRRYPLKLRLKNGLLYNCYSLFAAVPRSEALSQALSKPVACLTRPGGWLLYRNWKKKYENC